MALFAFGSEGDGNGLDTRIKFSAEMNYSSDGHGRGLYSRTAPAVQSIALTSPTMQTPNSSIYYKGLKPIGMYKGNSWQTFQGPKDHVEE